MKTLFFIFVFFILFAFLSATIINIPADQPTIQAGINVAVDGDTILVQPETYIENIDYDGKNIVVGSLFLTTQNTSYISQTVINGNQDGSVVTFESGEDSTAVLTGFTIMNGNSNYGGGIYCFGSSPTFIWNTIINNTVHHYGDSKGGGIYCYNSNPKLMNNTISNNSTGFPGDDGNNKGGGIYCYNSNPLITNNIISNNIAESEYGVPKGGGIYCYNSNPMLTNNTISSNSANNNYDDAEGGGIYCSGSSSPTFMNNNIIGNSVFGANVNGGGIFLDGGSPTFIENAISNNTSYGWSSYSNGGGIYCNNANPTLTNNIISNNNAYTESQYGFSKGGGIYCKSGNLNITDGTIIENTSSNEGGGIHCEDGSTPILTNVTIHENTASSYGGGIYCGKDSGPSLQNVVITDNYAFDCGGGIFCYFDSGPSLENVTITGNSANNGGGINFSYNSEPDFNLENRCNIYLNNVINSRGYGADIFSIECDIINVIVDTFTVLTPTDYYASPIDNFNFDILHGIQDTLINYDLYVSVDGDDSNAGTTADEPLKTIRCALSKIYADSLNHNTIHLLPGVYSSSTNGENFPIAWSNHVSLEGNSEDDTFLDGNNESGVMKFYYVNESMIRNITIRNGYGSYYGGGIYYFNSSPSLENVTITDNSASSGGGIYCSYSSPSLENVTITGNSASSYGGGIRCYYSNPNLENVTITGNSASDNGGGIYCSSNSSPSLQNVTITGNSASDNGGGIYCYSSSPSLQNVTITGNSASDNGGGIYCANSSPSLTNVTISENSANENGGGIYCRLDSLNLLNCILWNDSPQEIYIQSGSVTATYSDIQNGWTGIGNIDANPLFVGSGEHPYSLLEDSPCIDAGNPDPIYYDPEDPNNPGFALYPAMGTIINDMGAYGGPNASGWIYVSVEDEFFIEPMLCNLYHNYPNPFNPTTTISFNISRKDAKDAEIVIYNIKGQKVKQLKIEIRQLPDKINEVVWDGTDENNHPVSSGIYFYKLKVDDKTIATKKCLLLK